MGELSPEAKTQRNEARKDTAAVSRYLDTLQPKKRGRPYGRSLETERFSLEGIEAKLARDDLRPLDRLSLIQEKLDTQERIASLEAAEAPEVLNDFVERAARWAERTGVTRWAFEVMNVPKDVLDKAGITA